jgi:hypothetical protein
MSDTYAFHEHQGKGIGLVRALRDLGWTPAAQPDLFLIDFDGPPYYVEMIRRYKALGAKVALYPHGATAQLCLDIWDNSPEVDAYLAFSHGQAEVLRKFRYPRPVYVTGWQWCEQREARTLGSANRLLFAPIHPLGNGFLHPLHADANRRAFADILDHYPLDVISVRLVGTPEANGLQYVPGVEYHQASLEISTADMDRSDLVVSHGTFAYLSVARGLPTVMYGYDYPFMDGNSLGEAVSAKHWDEYADYMRDPVAVLDDLPGSEKTVRRWRDSFIGEQMTAARLGEALEAIFSD